MCSSAAAADDDDDDGSCKGNGGGEDGVFWDRSRLMPLEQGVPQNKGLGLGFSEWGA